MKRLSTIPRTLLLIAPTLFGVACRDSSAPNPAASQSQSPLPPAGSIPPPPSPGAQPPPGPPPGTQVAQVPPAERIRQSQVTVLPGSLHPSTATFGGGAIRYLGYQVEPEHPVPGQRFRLTHYWRAEKSIPDDWTIFVHFGIPEKEGNIFNADHVALEGGYPTSQWKVGAAFRDEQMFGLPPNLPLSQLEVYVGLYQGEKRMPLDNAPASKESRLFLGTISLGSGPNETPLPTYKVARAKGPLRIDGVLDEPAWKAARSTGPFVKTLDGSPTKYLTEAKLLWDDDFLYVGFTCQDEDVWSDFTKHDDKIYTQEAVEVFIDADGDGKTYNELEIAPTNATFDAYFPARRQGMDLSWESGMVTAVKIDGTLNDAKDVDRGWTAEAKIPIKSLAAVPHVPPRVGDRWRINLYRLDWHTHRQVNEGSAFSPLYQGDFHNLPRFGWLEFAP